MAPLEPSFEPQGLLAQLPFVRGLARELLKERAAADDVAQEAAAAALASRPPRGALRPWLVGVTRNLARMFRRGERRRAARERAAAMAEALPSNVDESLRFAALKRVVLALERLGEDDRALLVRRFYDEWPPRRIASELGVPVNTVRTRIARALERLRRELVEGGESDRARDAPALLFALLAPPPPLSAVPPVAAAALPVATGVLLMTAKAKFAVALAIVAIAAAGVALWPKDVARAPSLPGNPASATRAVETAVASATESAPATRTETSPSTPRPSATTPRRVIALRGRLLGTPEQLGRWLTSLTVSAAVDAERNGSFAAAPAPERFHSDVAVARDGTFSADLELDDLAPRIGRLTLAGLDPSFAPFHRWYAVPNGTAPRHEWTVEIHLFAAAPVRGRVVDEAGRPVDDVAVDAFSIVSGTAKLLGETRAGTDGEFRLGVAEPGECFIVASQRRFGPELGGFEPTRFEAPRLLPAVAAVTTDEVRETDVGELVLRPGATIRGRVEWFAHGPVAGAIVGAIVETQGVSTNSLLTRPVELPSGRPTSAAVATDEWGEFELTGLAPGPTRVSVRSLADGLLDLNGTSPRCARVAAPADAVVLRVDGAVVEFEVTSGGRPLEGASVSTRTHSDGATRTWKAIWNGQLVTGPEGKVRTFLPARAEVPWFATAPWHVDANGTFTAPADGERTVIPVALEPRASEPSLIVHVVDEQGAPITVAGIMLESKRDSTRGGEQEVHMAGGDQVATDGRFVIRGIVPGGNSLRVHPGGRFVAGDGCYVEICRDVTIQPGVVETIELTAVAAGRLRVVARDARGRFLAAHFTLRDDEGREMNAYPLELYEAADGSFQSLHTHNDQLATSDFSRIDPPLPPGRYVATLALPGFQTQTVGVEIRPLQATDLEVVLVESR